MISIVMHISTARSVGHVHNYHVWSDLLFSHSLQNQQQTKVNCVPRTAAYFIEEYFLQIYILCSSELGFLLAAGPCGF